ncbi:MAG: NRDE family protein [Phycisphaerales bacterium]|nr:NRDE family protein [Phycisphaerales bacterium]
MCTVTIIPLVGPDGERIGLRLATSRDESRQRPPALPPRVHRAGKHDSIWPSDPVGGGTWVGVNQSGLVATLLNRNDGSPPSTHPSPRSRGEIIPEILAQTSVSGAAEVVAALDARQYLPFTLVVTDGQNLLRAAAGASEVDVASQQLELQPAMFTSSGLGDALVEAPRRRLFDGWFGNQPSEWPQRQASFHRHRWPDRPHLSVCMSRADARTVSLTVVDAIAAQMRMSYWGDSPDACGDPVVVELPRSGAPR